MGLDCVGGAKQNKRISPRLCVQEVNADVLSLSSVHFENTNGFEVTNAYMFVPCTSVGGWRLFVGVRVRRRFRAGLIPDWLLVSTL